MSPSVIEGLTDAEVAWRKFLLDPSNVAVTSVAVGVGVGGVQPRLWRAPPTTARMAGAPTS